MSEPVTLREMQGGLNVDFHTVAAILRDPADDTSGLVPDACSIPPVNVGMRLPTFTNIRIRTARDAEIIFHAVRIGILPMVTQRLGSEGCKALCTGCVYVWEERSGGFSDPMEPGMERFSDGRSWGPSRYRTPNGLCHDVQVTVFDVL